MRLATGLFLLLAALIAVALLSDRIVARSNSRATPSHAADRGSPDAEPDIASEPTAPLKGRVVEEGTEKPVAGASVAAYAFGTGRTLETTSAEDGSFELPDGAAAFEILARHEGYGAGRLSVTGPRDVVVVRLPGVGGVRGRVVVRDDKSPVSPCRVSAIRAGGEQDYHSSLVRRVVPTTLLTDAVTTTRADGTFELAGLAPGAYTLLAEPEAPLLPEGEGVKVEAREVADAEIVVGRTAEILVDVFDEETGQPLDGALLEVEAGAGWPGRVPIVAEERAPGAYALQATVYTNGEFALMWMRVSRTGYASRTVLFAQTDTWEWGRSLRPGDRFRVALGRGATIFGHVWSSGKPAKDALLLVRPRSMSWILATGTAGADGAFEVSGIDAGDPVSVHVYDRALAPVAVVGLELKSGERRALEIGAPGRTAIEGRVVLEGGPRAGTLVSLQGGPGASTATGPDGWYRFEGLNAGRYELCASLGSGGYVKRHAEVAEGERLRVDFEPGAVISGVVVDARTGRHITGVSYLGVVAERPGFEDSVLVYAGGDGRFRLPADPGVYRIGSQSDDFYAVEHPLVDTTLAPVPEVELRVSRNTRSCSVTLDLRDERTGESVADCVYEYASGGYHYRGSKRGQSGPISLPGLAPGVYRIRVWSDAHAPSELEVRIDADRQEAREVVALRRSEAVRLTEVGRDSVAARAGLRKGDTILQCDGVATPSIAAFHAATDAAHGSMRVEYERNGERKLATVPTSDLYLGLENILLGR